MFCSYVPVEEFTVLRRTRYAIPLFIKCPVSDTYFKCHKNSHSRHSNVDTAARGVRNSTVNSSIV
jgi:hypothetical protein